MIPMKTFLAALAFALAMNWLFGGAARADCALHDVEPTVAAAPLPSDWQEKRHLATKQADTKPADAVVSDPAKKTAAVSTTDVRVK